MMGTKDVTNLMCENELMTKLHPTNGWCSSFGSWSQVSCTTGITGLESEKNYVSLKILDFEMELPTPLDVIKMAMSAVLRRLDKVPFAYQKSLSLWLVLELSPLLSSSIQNSDSLKGICVLAKAVLVVAIRFLMCPFGSETLLRN